MKDYENVAIVVRKSRTWLSVERKKHATASEKSISARYSTLRQGYFVEREGDGACGQEIYLQIEPFQKEQQKEVHRAGGRDMNGFVWGCLRVCFCACMLLVIGVDGVVCMAVVVGEIE